MEPKYIIYALVDPSTKEIRYIGKSSKGLARARQHNLNSKDTLNTNPHKLNWLKKLDSQGLSPTHIILKDLTALCLDKSKEEITEILSNEEITLIREHREAGCNLVNATDGGEGALGRIVSNDTKLKIAESQRKYYELHPEAAQAVGERVKKPTVFIEGIECKDCTKCKQVLPLENFHRVQKNGKWHRVPACRDCNRRNYQRVEVKMSRGGAKAQTALRAVSINDNIEMLFDSMGEAEKQGFYIRGIRRSIDTGESYQGYIWLIRELPVETPVTEKECTCCKQMLPAEQFKVLKHGSLNSWCNSCVKAENREQAERRKQERHARGLQKSAMTKKVQALTEAGEVALEFASLGEADRNGYSLKSIKRNIKLATPYKGFYWKLG